MFPYHNQIKKRIRNKELIDYEYVESYKKIKPCLLLFFNTEPLTRPIRKHRFKEYELLLNKKQIDKKYIIYTILSAICFIGSEEGD